MVYSGVCHALEGVYEFCCKSLLPDQLRACPVNARTSSICRHLGELIERDSVAVKIKCGCSGKAAEQHHVAHRCAIHQRCLPTLVPKDLQAWRERQLEIEIYLLCHVCIDRQSLKLPTAAVRPARNS
ncbi:hypothetical protein Pla144_23870 [Bythopirellula polymerisocia]|uniref:Uncharacterized protein n=1 Tax=Bythopirellula polymerisocia TaxID=2528003 RepID=A0A5C6CSS0_9BACT|nr:hypothetical protein Pla144_23870 [Bythopirellula polymerisocia]